jgi:short-subunit dehydrogenase
MMLAIPPWARSSNQTATESGFFEATRANPAIIAQVPKRLTASSASVAQAAVSGMQAGKPVVIPGLVNRLAAAGGHLMPRRVLMPIESRFYPATKA